VQSAEDEDIHRHEAFALPDFMNRRLESVNVNEVQNNPYQPDITYRGFNASPILGTPIAYLFTRMAFESTKHLVTR